MTAIVMAAGLSTRMGADKLTLPLEGKPVFVHILSRVCALPFAERLVVTNQAQIAQYAVQHGFRVVPSPNAALGMGYSVAAGARAVRADVQGIMFLNADQPFISREMIENLWKSVLRKESNHGSLCQRKAKQSLYFPDSIPSGAGSVDWRTGRKAGVSEAFGRNLLCATTKCRVVCGFGLSVRLSSLPTIKKDALASFF